MGSFQKTGSSLFLYSLTLNIFYNIHTSMYFPDYKKRDLTIFYIFIVIAIIVLGYQFFLYYFPIWNEKVPTHWNNKPMANDWTLASNWYLSMSLVSVIFCSIIFIIAYILSKFFVMGTKEFRYSPFTISLPLSFTFFFFFMGINESVYSSYIAKGILSNTGIGIFYFVIAGISLFITILSVLIAPLALQDD